MIVRFPCNIHVLGGEQIIIFTWAGVNIRGELDAYGNFLTKYIWCYQKKYSIFTKQKINI